MMKEKNVEKEEASTKESLILKYKQIKLRLREQEFSLLKERSKILQEKIKLHNAQNEETSK